MFFYGKRFNKFDKMFVMNEIEEIRRKIIETINELPKDKLIEVDVLIKKISLESTNSIENIYREAKKKYNETLQKLAD